MVEFPTSPSRDSRADGSGDTDVDSISDQLCADLVQRWNRGERVPVEAYLRQHPELESGDSALELILTEVALRQESGEAAPLEEYLWRFPRYEDRLRRHFALQEGLVSGGASSAAAVAVAPPAAAPSAQSLPAVAGYEIVEQIGRGGMGNVYKARETSLGRHVAIKLLRDDQSRAPDQLARFLREARTASALNHPGICTVHALGEHNGGPFIVMEHIEGLTLRAIVERRPLPDDVARLIGLAAQALAAAHAAGVVHRDIKPENIMARADGHVKVVDFGLARLMPAGFPIEVLAGNDSAADAGVMVGTLSYMSPEQTRCEAAGATSDVFSLGIVAYELLTGRHPFEGASVAAIFNAITSQSPLPPRRLVPGLSADLEALILQMLEKDPRLRPTAAEIGAALGRETRTRMKLTGAATEEANGRRTVGREVEREALWQAFEAADAGTAILLCVSGEPGIGKTTLVEEWLQELRDSARVVGIGRGSCSERLAGTGSYLPVLEALDGLLRGEAGSSVARMMRELAPAWYAQVAPMQGDSSSVLRRAGAATHERMKREFLALAVAIGRRLPLVFFFDDLHWADASTVDLMAWLGRHFAGLRLMIVTTYRPAEMRSGKHPFLPVQFELQRHGVCRELPLAFLTQAEVENFLALEFAEHRFPADFAAQLHLTTEGNPLFLAELVHHLRDRGVIACREGRWKLAQTIPDFQKDLPVSVRSLIHNQIDRLDEADRRLLSAGSVQGYEFDAAIAAGVLARSAAEVEERLELLDRVHGLVRLVREHEFPDATVTLRYRFVHVLYQNALYAAVPPSRRAQWSAAVAQALLDHHGSQNAVIASEAALLFENARAWGRAAECFYLACRHPLRLHAHREAAVLARCGLEMLARMPENADRARQEARLQFALGLALQPSEGFAAPAVVDAYRRARALSHFVEIETASRSPLLWGLWSFYILRGEHRSAKEIADELAELAQGQTDSLVSLAADHSMGYSLMMLGQPVAAWSHLGRDLPTETQAVHGRDIGIPFRAHGAVVLWLLGFPDRAVARSRQAASLALEKLDYYGLAIALFNTAKVHQLRREAEAVAQYSQSLLTLADEQAFPVWLAAGTVLAGWAAAQRGDWNEGTARIREGIAAFLANGAAMMHPYFLGLLAETLEAGGQFDEALDVVDRAQAIVADSSERYFEAELHRLRGELLLKPDRGIDRTADAGDCFQKALDLARHQQARSLELRAAVSAARLLQSRGQSPGEMSGVRSLLEPVCSQFAEGLDSSDWRAAAALLNESG
jgi:tRNA A-37 threonylcarbamoyl transferase component Bud32/tetratricopeptide (TPR) repeat protein